MGAPLLLASKVRAAGQQQGQAGRTESRAQASGDIHPRSSISVPQPEGSDSADSHASVQDDAALQNRAQLVSGFRPLRACRVDLTKPRSEFWPTDDRCKWF